MVGLLFVASVFFFFALGSLFIHYTFHSKGKTYQAKIIGIHKYRNKPRPQSSNYTGFYYAPVIEYFYKGEKVIFIGAGDGRLKYSIGEKIEVLVVDEIKENVILKDYVYLTFGCFFLSFSFLAGIFYFLNSSSSFITKTFPVFFILMPPFLFISRKNKIQAFLKIALLKNSNIKTMEELESMEIIWAEAQLGVIKNQSNKVALIFCCILSVIAFLMSFYAWGLVDHSTIATIEQFARREISWNDLTSQTKKFIFLTGSSFYMTVIVLFSFSRLLKKKKKSDLISIDE